MKKTFKLGKIGYYNTHEFNLCELTAELKDAKKGPVFSMTACIWDARHYDHIIGGQCCEEVCGFFPENSTAQELLRLWKLYHLNDMHAGTEAQEAHLAAMEATKPANVGHYTWACETLKTAGLYEVMVDGKPYKYSYSWLYRAIPEADLARIRELLS